MCNHLASLLLDAFHICEHANRELGSRGVVGECVCTTALEPEMIEFEVDHGQIESCTEEEGDYTCKGSSKQLSKRFRFIRTPGSSQRFTGHRWVDVTSFFWVFFAELYGFFQWTRPLELTSTLNSNEATCMH